MHGSEKMLSGCTVATVLSPVQTTGSLKHTTLSSYVRATHLNDEFHKARLTRNATTKAISMAHAC